MKRTFVRTGNGLISEAETNLLKEFWPDISRNFLLHRIQETRPIQKIGQSLALRTLPQRNHGNLVTVYLCASRLRYKKGARAEKLA